ncbi:ArsR/SmtB family transcription factor [Brucella tritici]|uniref:Winged helix-turn-helix transcriptional regulator n=1 Tax=Brucella tritici TaxID=94626 RepID=A0A6L3YMX6_9HYPH|nr:metalloregulator ArsR/SmtB family transcription factor [Brucella tritici]KAB2684394.1 winged helix-turn-helix transcriptional regulator [Brucella tritici]
MTAHQHPSDILWVAETFRLLGDPSRLKILLYCEHRPRSVTDISVALQLSQSLVSHHLRLLKTARLVTGVRYARRMLYQVSDRHIGDVLHDMLVHAREGDRSDEHNPTSFDR